EVKHAASENPISADTRATPLGVISSRPLFALHRSTGMKTVAAGCKAVGRGKAIGFVPLVQIAALRCTIPEMSRAAAAEVWNGAFCQPLRSLSLVNDAADLAKETPSSEVTHAAWAKTPPSACMVTTPFGVMCSRPLFAPHRAEVT